MDISLLTVYESEFPKRRIGREKDGGYVISEVPGKYGILLSAGLSDDISFEEDFLKHHPELPCVAFDGTISRLPSEHSRIQWVSKNVGLTNSDSQDNLSSYLSQQDVFLKMDIEGAEVDWILNSDLGNVRQMVVEFHQSPFSDRHERMFRKLNETHVLVHLHGNNFSGTVKHGDYLLPFAFECTYLRKHLVPSPRPNREILPGPLDKPNNPSGRDLDLNRPPFVN